MKMHKLLLILLLSSVLLTTSVSALEGQMAEEFAFLSGQTVLAMELSPEELQGLVGACDLLLEKSSSLQKSEKKIFKKRLTRLRGLFLYVLESKQASGAEEPEK